MWVNGSYVKLRTVIQNLLHYLFSSAECFENTHSDPNQMSSECVEYIYK